MMTELENELNCCRDSSGRFAPVMTTEELKRYSEMTIRMREIEKQARRNAHMLNFESQLLYILVGFFEKPYVKEAERYSYYDLRRFPRKRYHDVLMVHPSSRNRLIPSQSTPGLTQPSNVACASFCTLINRLEKKGWVRRIKDGLELYLECKTQQEIADSCDISQAGVHKILENITKRIIAESNNSPPDSLQIENLWDFSRCDNAYGTKDYPGRMAGQIIENLPDFLTNYTLFGSF